MIEVLGLILCTAAFSQTVSPVLSECSKKCSGEFSVTNNSVQPLAVTVEAVSFSMDTEGRPTYRPLDSTVEVKLDEQSARVAPKGTHSFSYSLRCNAAPCAVTFVSSMVVGHTKDGIVVRVQLPSTVYMCEKQNGCRSSVRVAAGAKAD